MQPLDTTTDLPPPGYMLESEVRFILQNFNATLGTFAQQVEELTRQRSICSTRLMAEEAQTRELRLKLNEVQVELDRTRTRLQLKETELERLHTILDRRVGTSAEEQEASMRQVEQLRQSLVESPVGSEALDLLSRLLEEERRLSSVNVSLSAECQGLREELRKITMKEEEPVKCFKCKLQYVPYMNSKEACVFHSGKLKYYSCKGCGDDPYYTCCNQCDKCSRGCRSGLHVPASK
jgi:hypothetical protein